MSSAHAPAMARPGVPRQRDHHWWSDAAYWVLEHRAQLLASIALTAIAVGGILHVVGAGSAGHAVWRAAVALLAVEVGRTIVNEHSLGVDTIALVAMVGALALDQELEGVVIGLMWTGDASLEAIASRRAHRELTALAQRAPKVRNRGSATACRKFRAMPSGRVTWCSCAPARWCRSTASRMPLTSGVERWTSPGRAC